RVFEGVEAVTRGASRVGAGEWLARFSGRIFLIRPFCGLLRTARRDVRFHLSVTMQDICEGRVSFTRRRQKSLALPWRAPSLVRFQWLTTGSKELPTSMT